MRCYRKILRISYKDHVTNKEVRDKIQHAIGPQEDLLTIVKRRKCSGMDMSLVQQVWPKQHARYSERGKKTKQTTTTTKKVGRQHQEMDSPGVRQVQEGSEEQRKLEETGWVVICGAPTTPAFKGWWSFSPFSKDKVGGTFGCLKARNGKIMTTVFRG